MKPSPNQKHLVAKPFRHWLYRYGSALSVVMVALSLISNIGTQIASWFGARPEEHASADNLRKGLLPYEMPSFNVINNVFVNDALATSPTLGPLGVLVIGTLT